VPTPTLSTTISLVLALTCPICAGSLGDGQPQWSGIFPHLAYWNTHGECGTGAVVPWADRLWLVTYGPHYPKGSSDRLYEIDRDLNIRAREESVGGTHANRMIHRESQQLFIGLHAVDAERNVRTIGPGEMIGRMTGVARHLTRPAEKLYFGTMEEGFYEVDVASLAVKKLYRDAHDKTGPTADLPGCHGKGLYSGQGVLVYANNGEHGAAARSNPNTPSGCLAEWNGATWKVVRRNQFTEVTGPGGIYGNANPETEPIWSIGWDHRSLILMLRDRGRWHSFRLPKNSHCYDGAHGWNTEWPRIREIGEDDLLMTMHGCFWRFPKAFCAASASGIVPRSAYLKVVGDFCRWEDRVALGCDDTAASQFINTRKAKEGLGHPGQSHSNLWFVEAKRLDHLGPALGQGGVWVDEDVKANRPSEAFLLGGYAHRGLSLSHRSNREARFVLEFDDTGDGSFDRKREVTLGAHGAMWIPFEPNDPGQWIRIVAMQETPGATAYFHFRQKDGRGSDASEVFKGLAAPDERDVTGGAMIVRGDGHKTIGFAAVRPGETGELVKVGYYELDGAMRLAPVDDAQAYAHVKKNACLATGVISCDAASAIYTDEHGRRYRLPVDDSKFRDPLLLGGYRCDREVVTERDLFNCCGTFYELPAENAGGFSKIRPIATHNRQIYDYAGYRGLLVMTGIADDANATTNRHIIRSTDGKFAVWVGAIDDLWKLGKPRGVGGPWKDTPVEASKPSDPYLMTGFDKKTLHLSHQSDETVNVEVQVDVTGEGLWRSYQTFAVPPGKTVAHVFPTSFGAYWARCAADHHTTATATFVYE